MSNTNKLLSVAFFALAVFLSSCSKDDSSGTVLSANSTAEKSASSLNGRLYTMTNDATQNGILELTESSSGAYAISDTINSGGKGTGAPLGSQGSIVMDANHDFLYAVNAGDNTISSFKIASDGGLTLMHTVDCKGTTPVSLTIYNNWLYVVNYGSDNVVGFTVGTDGSFSYISGSNHQLSTTGTQPAEIKFRPDGSYLYVTEKATNIISVFSVDKNGLASGRTSVASTGQEPFGFDFGAGVNMIVADAYNGVGGAAAATSYKAGTTGKLKLISGPVFNSQTATCWVAVTSDSHYALTTNTGSNTISVYKITSDGMLSIVTQVGASTGAAPADIVIKSHYAYTVNQTGQSLGEFKINNDGTLTSVGEVFGLPAGDSGLASN